MKTKKNKTSQTFCATLLAMVGFTACVALAADTSTQTIKFTQQSGGSGTGCPGATLGYALMTNSDGTYWITPPTNTISGTLTDASAFGTNYVSIAYVRCNNMIAWCGTNHVTFPATNSLKYRLEVAVKNTPPPPTNGQPMSLKITWLTQ